MGLPQGACSRDCLDEQNSIGNSSGSAGFRCGSMNLNSAFKNLEIWTRKDGDEEGTNDDRSRSTGVGAI
jgi:hypothetical protein